MAQSKEDVKHGVAQAQLSEDEQLRVAYKHGTPLEGGKVADAEPVDLLADARRVAAATGSSLRRGGKDGDGDLSSRERGSHEQEKEANNI